MKKKSPKPRGPPKVPTKDIYVKRGTRYHLKLAGKGRTIETVEIPGRISRPFSKFERRK